MKLVVESDQGCRDSISEVLFIYGHPEANFSQNTAVAKPGYPVQFTDLSIDAVKWYWDFGNDTYSEEQNPTTSVSDTGYFDVSLVVENIYTCTDTAWSNLFSVYGPVVPMAFSPNGDGHNDKIHVFGGPFSQFEFTIFNNWGEVIYRSNDITEGWDGTRNGVEQPIGVYVYTVNAIGKDGIEYIKMHGDITLLR